eukprot:CAMPEP_0175039744 /NCGR_PEP_ID=MMETSP0052_2-20121109/805_1 /TAXON_ID=51329 ORGANISM="Polytomella parva, Strain SAG 63-3" /NCGR_SAMPLE_ID=MMETSP0052_2 /ASSEMBLY_ACC=CAM_ASM_000194 /LENGTH=269 /DNA_ID=CAMNT_0016301733 /DNA_START=206 /DNA_END=1012 /DNA_ORIENTATION=-
MGPSRNYSEDETLSYELKDSFTGVAYAMYHYLWMKDSEGKTCPNVNIPHTVIFKGGKPREWFFTSLKENILKRKHKSNVTHFNIVETMAVGEEADLGICCSFRGAVAHPIVDSNRHNNHGVFRMKNGMHVDEDSAQWLGVKALRELLPANVSIVSTLVAELHDGVLQRWVHPRGGIHNTVYKALWSPHACVIQCRTTRARMNEVGVTLADRLSTWEGPIWSCEQSTILGSVLQSRAEVMCESIASHVSNVSSGNIVIASMNVLFKVDDS